MQRFSFRHASVQFIALCCRGLRVGQQSYIFFPLCAFLACRSLFRCKFIHKHTHTHNHSNTYMYSMYNTYRWYNFHSGDELIIECFPSKSKLSSTQRKVYRMGCRHIIICTCWQFRWKEKRKSDFLQTAGHQQSEYRACAVDRFVCFDDCCACFSFFLQVCVCVCVYFSFCF